MSAAIASRVSMLDDRIDRETLAWLLEPDTPAVRHLALRDLVGPADAPEVVAARRAALDVAPIAAILAAQHPDGYWVQPGPGYAPKYRGTVWQLIFLDQLGADPADERVQRACDYVLEHSRTAIGGFGASFASTLAPPPPSAALHCLTGNLLRALIGFGRLDDLRVQHAIDWQAAAITGEGVKRWYPSGTSGPGFGCAGNGRYPCAWGAITALGGLARVPTERRTPEVRRAIDVGVAFLLERDPAVADYQASDGGRRPNGSWFKLGFPSAYVSDVLRNLELLCELGYGHDPRLANAVAWLIAKRDEQRRWRNEYAYSGKTWVDVDRPGAVSKWVTLRACRVLAAALSDGLTDGPADEIALRPAP